MTGSLQPEAGSQQNVSLASGQYAEVRSASAQLDQPAAGAEILPLTGLRGFLAWWVVFFHLSALIEQLFPACLPLRDLWTSGDAAVDVFFILSGFVIRLAYARPGHVFTAGTYVRFLWARWARLYPVHVIQQLAWAAVVIYAVSLGNRSVPPEGIKLEELARNLFLVHAWGIPMKMYWNYPAWSISLEWLAYLLTPVVFSCVGRVRTSAQGVVVLLLLWVTLLIGETGPAVHFFRIGCGYTTGALLAAPFFRLRVPTWALRLRLATALLLVCSIATLHSFELPYSYALPLAALLVLLLAAPGAQASILAHRWSVFMGRASYSLYMTHALSITVMHQLAHPSRYMTSPLWARVAVFAVYLLLISAAAVASYLLVEEPARKALRNMFARRAAPSPS